MQPLQLEGGTESCGAPSSGLDEGRMIVLCADLVIMVYRSVFIQLGSERDLTE